MVRVSELTPLLLETVGCRIFRNQDPLHFGVPDFLHQMTSRPCFSFSNFKVMGALEVTFKVLKAARNLSNCKRVQRNAHLSHHIILQCIIYCQEILEIKITNLEIKVIALKLRECITKDLL